MTSSLEAWGCLPQSSRFRFGKLSAAPERFSRSQKLKTSPWRTSHPACAAEVIPAGGARERLATILFQQSRGLLHFSAWLALLARLFPGPAREDPCICRSQARLFVSQRPETGAVEIVALHGIKATRKLRRSGKNLGSPECLPSASPFSLPKPEHSMTGMHNRQF